MTVQGRLRAWRPRRRLRVAATTGLDAIAWLLGLAAATWMRYALEGADVSTGLLPEIALTAIVAQVALTLVLHLHRGRQTFGSADDVVDLGTTTAVVTVLIFLVNAFGPVLMVPRSVPVTAALIALAISVTGRFVVRRHLERSSRPDHASAQRVLVFGAGLGGQQLIRSMLSDGASGYLPVALLDDDPDARRRRVCGVSVRGSHRDIETIAALSGATMIIVAVRDVPNDVMRDIVHDATRCGLSVKVLPPLSELFRAWVGFSDLRDLDITDLLRRSPVDTDVASIAGYLTGKRVLVTGAGGSIGSELCRQLDGFGPAELMMLDRDESALHAVQLSIQGRALLDSSDVILADIRDADAIDTIFHQRRPDVVFHAAALKHLPMLEQYPDEAWKTNVVGTQNVLDAAHMVGVDKFVNISTDKAANPTSVLGRSKRIGERLVAEAADITGTPYLSVRFGNVLGSRGSVLTTFTEQLAAGGPITVTHPDVTRYFMTIPEAVQLVVQAAAVGRPGEALVLDMGEPVRILDLAHQLMEIAGQGAPIVYTGLREGEKLHEELFGEGEIGRRPAHPLISHVDVPALSFAQARRHVSLVGARAAMVELLAGAPSGPWLGDLLASGPVGGLWGIR